MQKLLITFLLLAIYSISLSQLLTEIDEDLEFDDEEVDEESFSEDIDDESDFEDHE